MPEGRLVSCDAMASRRGQLTKLGVVRVKTEMPEGRLVSFN